MTDFLRKAWTQNDALNMAEFMIKLSLALITAMAVIRFIAAVR